MCERTACALEPNTYYETINKNLGSKSIQTWNQKENYSPGFNLGPTSNLPVVYMIKDQNQEVLELHTMRWGLIPSFYKEINNSMPMHKARGETVSEKGMFNRLLSSRRCICMVDGFYEWKRVKKQKQPYFVKNKDGKPIFLAGIYDIWNSHDNEMIYSFTIITVESPEKYSSMLHHRIPIILETEESKEIWLNFEKYSKEKALELIKPIDISLLDFYPVSDYVNKTTNEGEKCIKKIDPSSKKGPIDRFFKPKVKKEETIEIEKETKKDVKKEIIEKKEEISIPTKIKIENSLIIESQESELNSQDLEFIENIEKQKEEKPLTIDLIQEEEEENEWDLKRKQRSGEDHEWIEFKKIKFNH